MEWEIDQIQGLSFGFIFLNNKQNVKIWDNSRIVNLPKNVGDMPWFALVY